MNKLICLMVLPAVLSKNISIQRKGRLTIGSSESYTFHSTPATFNEAISICKQEGGSLAVVTSQKAEDEMLKIWKHSSPILNSTNGLTSQAFIGIHSLNKKGHWETIDGESPKYINWSQHWSGGRKPSTSSVQKCGSLLKHGGLDNVECYFKLAFFCTKE
uniref:Lectin n=1 Tax=Bracoviriform rubeculae TaxID=47223 RepID=Q80MM6_9VIRU|nr:lectin [Bracoviriform rubeculae]